jgi:hypothetical protein
MSRCEFPFTSSATKTSTGARLYKVRFQEAAVGGLLPEALTAIIFSRHTSLIHGAAANKPTRRYAILSKTRHSSHVPGEEHYQRCYALPERHRAHTQNRQIHACYWSPRPVRELRKDTLTTGIGDGPIKATIVLYWAN